MFLKYLAREQFIDNPMLYLALPASSAPHESIVEVLSADEVAEIMQVIQAENSSLTLREKAILLLGLKMGLRPSDIVNISLDNISFEKCSIRFTQLKTKVEIELPMPVSVANAIYRYLLEERPDSTSRKLFVRKKTSGMKLTRNACTDALNAAYSDIDAEPKGFRIRTCSARQGIFVQDARLDLELPFSYAPATELQVGYA